MKRARQPVQRRGVSKKRRVQRGPSRQRLPQSELKFLDQSVDVDTIAAAGEIASASLVVIPQGADESNRIGRKVTVKQIGIKADLFLPASTSANFTTDTVRLILYHDKQANGATATMANLLESGTDWLSFRNLTETGRFQFLLDKLYTLNSHLSGNGTTDQSGAYQEHVEFYHSCNIPIEYSSTAGVLTEIRSNNLGLACISRNGLVDLDSVIRVRYTDA